MYDGSWFLRTFQGELGSQQTPPIDYRSGEIIIFLLERNGSVFKSYPVNRAVSNLGTSIRPMSQFGSALGVLPDVNNDGIMELMVGAYHDMSGGKYSGSLWLINLPSTGR